MRGRDRRIGSISMQRLNRCRDEMLVLALEVLLGVSGGSEPSLRELLTEDRKRPSWISAGVVGALRSYW